MRRRPRTPPLRALAALVLLSATACGESHVTCRVGADCASGVCLSSGTCGDYQAADAGDAGGARFAPDGTQQDGATVDGAAVDSGSASKDAAGGDAVSKDTGKKPLCTPNHDGVVTRDEVVMGADLSANFRVALDAPVNTAGTEAQDGTRVWDFAQAVKGDADVDVTTHALTDQWFAKDFPTATYVARFNTEDDLLGVYEVSGDALLLLAAVSKSDGLLRTKLTYQPPVTVQKYPLKAGVTWSTKTTVSGQASGALANYSESWSSQVDSSGVAKTPYGNFPVLRVRSTVVQQLMPLVTRTTRSMLFVAECFGPVVSVRSQTDETQAEFTSAAELRRLAP